MKSKSNMFSPSSIRKAAEKSLQTWKRIKTLVFFLFLAAAIAFGGYIWYGSIYRSAWSDAQRAQYIKTQGAGVAFKEDEFKKIVNDVNMRKSDEAQQTQSLKNIFLSY
jgi:hypothetical protein